MARANAGFWEKWVRFPWQASGVFVLGLSLTGSGCSQMPPNSGGSIQPQLLSRASSQAHTLATGNSGLGGSRWVSASEVPANKSIILASATEPTPTTGTLGETLAPAPTPLAPAAPADHALPIGLDTVFRLAEQQNAQVALARAKVQEAYAEKEVAAAKWLPDLYAATGYSRHEGGIQNEDGTLTHSSFGSLFEGLELKGNIDIREVAFQQVNAQRQVLQQRGELSKVTSETLLEASGTYIDLLTARTGEVISRQMQEDLKTVLERAKTLASEDRGVRVEVERVQAEMAGQERSILKVRAQAAAAQAKLIYLLGLDPCAQLVPVDTKLMPFELIDATPPTCDLVAQALATGPGIQELQGLLTLIQESLERADGPGKYLPAFQVGMLEGAFGAGPGDQVSWDNRWDLGLQARWNLTEFLTARQRRQVALTKMTQAQLAYQDLRGKLTAGVQEARESVLSGKEQIRHAQEQIEHAQQAVKLSSERLKHVAETRATPSEVLLAIEALGRAQLNYLTSINEFDKAQLRLMVLLGPTATQPGYPLAGKNKNLAPSDCQSPQINDNNP